jgi:hypothetical protein
MRAATASVSLKRLEKWWELGDPICFGRAKQSQVHENRPSRAAYPFENKSPSDVEKAAITASHPPRHALADGFPEVDHLLLGDLEHGGDRGVLQWQVVPDLRQLLRRQAHGPGDLPQAGPAGEVGRAVGPFVGAARCRERIALNAWLTVLSPRPHLPRCSLGEGSGKTLRSHRGRGQNSWRIGDCYGSYRRWSATPPWFYSKFGQVRQNNGGTMNIPEDKL